MYMGDYMFEFLKRKKSDETKNLEKTAKAAGAGSKSVSIGRHSNASHEYVKAYTGFDNMTGKHMQKSLSGIGKSKINPAYRDNNIKQQAGFAAEVMEVAEKNAENQLKGDPTRYTRVDDVPGRQINETAFDVTAFDAFGNELLSESSQLKFTKSNAASQAKQLTGKAFREKYPHGKYTVAKDRYEGIQNNLASKEQRLSNQIAKMKQRGDYEKARQLQEDLDYTKKVKANLKASELTTEQAIEARLHPGRTIAKKIVETGHEQGKEFALFSAVVEGVMSSSRNVYQCLNGEISKEEAAENITEDVAKAGAKGYLLGQGGNLLGTALKSSGNEIVRKMGEGSAPVQMIMFCKDALSLTADMMEGQIGSYEYMEGITKSGVNIAGSAAIGAAVGGPVGFVAAMASGILINAALSCGLAEIGKSYYQAKEERVQIEKECNMLREELQKYQTIFKQTYEAHTDELFTIFGDSIKSMAIAIDMNDANSFIASTNRITEALGGNTQFSNVDEFIDFVDSGDTLEL